MTSLSYTAFGEKRSITLSPAHILSNALDAFLQVDNPGAEIRAITDLSIGTEIFIKKELHLIEPAVVNPKVDRKSFDRIVAQASQKTKLQERRKSLVSELSSLPRSANVVSFEQAIRLLPFFGRVPLNILNAMDELRVYRNGLFHWEADPADLFDLARRSLDLYLWLFKYLEKKNGWYLGGEINILDPLAMKRRQLAELNLFRRSERLFNAKRRIYKHHNDYGMFVRVSARLDGTITRPHGVRWPREKCPACNTASLQVEDFRNTRDGRKEKGVIAVVCTTCEVFLTEDEFDRINPSNPRLRQIAAALGMKL